MKTARISIAILVASMGLFAASTARAGADYHVDDVALRLERQAKQLARELRYNFRHAAHFGHLMADARNIARSARHIHDVAHRGGSLRHLKSDLREIDDKVHHLTDLMRDIREDASHGHGHFDGNPRRAFRLVREMTNTVHHLQRDVKLAIRAQRGHHGHGHRVHYRPAPRQQAGISWNGKNFAIHFGGRF